MMNIPQSLSLTCAEQAETRHENEQAIEYFKKALDLDPLSLQIKKITFLIYIPKANEDSFPIVVSLAKLNRRSGSFMVTGLDLEYEIIENYEKAHEY